MATGLPDNRGAAPTRRRHIALALCVGLLAVAGLVVFGPRAALADRDQPAPKPDLCASPDSPPNCPPHGGEDALPVGEVPEIAVEAGEPGATGQSAATGKQQSFGPNTTESDCGTFDVICTIGRGINQWFTDLVTDAMKPVLNLIAGTTLATPNVAGNADIVALHGTTRWVANSLFVVFVVAGGFVVASHETLQTRYALRETLPRIVFGFLAVNASLPLIGMAISGINAVTAAVLGGDPAGATEDIKQELTGQLRHGGIFMILVALVVLVLAVILLAIYVVRLALTIVVVVAGPLALLCHASPYTEPVAKLWWRALIGVLSIQLLQAITLIVFVKVFFVQGSDGNRGVLGMSGQLMNLIVAAVLLYLLIKIPVGVLRQLSPSGARSAIASVIKYSLVARGMSTLGLSHSSSAHISGARRGQSRGLAGGHGTSRGSSGSRTGAGNGRHEGHTVGRTRGPGSDTADTRERRHRTEVVAQRARHAARRAWAPASGSRHTPPPAGVDPPTSSRPVPVPATGPFTPVPSRPAPPLERTPAGAGRPIISPAEASRPVRSATGAGRRVSTNAQPPPPRTGRANQPDPPAARRRS